MKKFLRQFLCSIVIPVSLSFCPEFAKSAERGFEAEHEELLGYKISNAVLGLALQPRTPSFERIEFLGDRVLGLIVAQLLYEGFPLREVDKLAQLFEVFVSNYNLAKMYKMLHIVPIRLLSPYYNPPLHTPLCEKTMSDIVEAIMGAMYQEGGLSLANAFGTKLFEQCYEFPQKIGTLTLRDHLLSKVAGLEEVLSYRFKDIKLLKGAFRHPSVGGTVYKKLDFIGVRVLALAVAENLFYSYPEYEEGILTDLFTRAVSNDNLQRIFKQWRLARYLSQQSDNRIFLYRGNTSTRIAANTVRTLIGAVYLDGGWEAAQSICGLLLYSTPSIELSENPAMPSCQWSIETSESQSEAQEEIWHSLSYDQPQLPCIQLNESKSEIQEEMWPSLNAEPQLPSVCPDGTDKKVQWPSQSSYRDVLMTPAIPVKVEVPSKKPDDPWPSLSGAAAMPPKISAWPVIKRESSTPKPETQVPPSVIGRKKPSMATSTDDSWPSLNSSVAMPSKAPSWPVVKKATLPSNQKLKPSPLEYNV